MMDVENLNRTQIILLTLLISFVTSIATGIVTVSLMQQAPTSVINTINRVVDHTVEKVISAPGPSIVTKETTVVVQADEAMTSSVDKTSKSLVAVYEKVPGADGVLQKNFIAWGLALSASGVIATDSGIITESGVYDIADMAGTHFEVTLINQDENLGVALLQAKIPDGTKYSFIPASLESAGKIRLGQTGIVFGGKEKISVSSGIVSSISTIDEPVDGTTTPNTVLAFIDSSVSPAGDVRGSALVDLTGNILGIREGDHAARFVSSVILAEKLAALSSAPAKKAQ